MPDNSKFGIITEQGFLGEGYGFTEASDEDREKFEEDNCGNGNNCDHQ